MARTAFADIEAVYERLALAIDQAGEAKASLFLAKLALLLARELDNREKSLAAIETALADIA